jgi:hypothetical protein
VLRRAEKPLTAREMMLAILDGKEPTATRKQELDVQAAILAALRKHQGKASRRSGKADQCGGAWSLNTEFNGSGGLRIHVRTVPICGISSLRLWPQLPPSWGLFLSARVGQYHVKSTLLPASKLTPQSGLPDRHCSLVDCPHAMNSLARSGGGKRPQCDGGCRFQRGVGG